MFCKKCGGEINSGASFCKKCGTNTSDNVGSNSAISQDHFYSEDWTKKGTFSIASLPYFDVMVDDKYVYFIKLPKYSSGTVYMLVGLVLLNLLGAIIGNIMGNANDKEKRMKYRSSWLGSGQKLISQNFEKNVYFKVPIGKAKNLLILEKHKITVSNGDDKIVLQKNKKEVERLNNYLNSYVL